jgi:hypothetical protein
VTVVGTPKGRVVCQWQNQGATFDLEVEIPEGMKATAILPSGVRKTLRSGKQTIREPRHDTGAL